MSTQYLAKIKEFLLKNERNIVLIVAFCLVCAISFEFGIMQGQKSQSKPLVIEKQATIPDQPQTAQNAAPVSPQGASVATVTQTGAQAPKTSNLAPNTSSCAFVGSKNSTLFYVPTCSWAKRIKPENLACYTSEADAIAKGKTKRECK